MVDTYDENVSGFVDKAANGDGELVLREDHEKLQQECEALKVENERLKASLSQMTECAKESQGWNWLSAQESDHTINTGRYEIEEMDNLEKIAFSDNDDALNNNREIAARAVEQMAAEWKTNSYEAELIRATCASHASKIRNGEAT